MTQGDKVRQKEISPFHCADSMLQLIRMKIKQKIQQEGK